jgi:hypothetical protein
VTGWITAVIWRVKTSYDDGDGYPEALDFAKRMGLINEAEDEVTPLGLEYLERGS